MGWVAAQTPLFGRERELELLVEQMTPVDHGRGGVALIAGEPGIGKTRLLHELVERMCTRTSAITSAGTINYRSD